MSTKIVTFHEAAYAMSCTRSRREHAAPSIGLLLTTAAKHLSMLDDIACLLATGEKNDVAAVISIQSSTEVTFYYAKNEPVPETFKLYLSTVQNIIAVHRNPKNLQLELLNVVFNTCLHKIRRRLCKLKAAVTGGGLDKMRVASGVAGDAKNLSHVLAVWAGEADGEILALMLDKIRTKE